MKAVISVLTCCLVGWPAWDAVAVEFRSMSGAGNNAAHETWGAAGSMLQRESIAAYADGKQALREGPNPRTLSNDLFHQLGDHPNANGLSSGTWQWGQFLDHDIALVLNNPFLDSVPIMPPQPDPMGMNMIPFGRSQSVVDEQGVRQQINSVTSFIDGSQIYGSDDVRAQALRTMSGGLLKTGPSSLLPLSDQDADLAGVFMDDGLLGEQPLFVAGDIRANEQPGLTAMHTVFLREHNRLAKQIAGLQPDFTDEQVYQSARKVVGAEIQAITYREFLPLLLGEHAPRADDVSYNPHVDATLLTEFSTFAYRVGHTMLNPSLLRMNESGVVNAEFDLRDVFFRPRVVYENPAAIEQVLLGLAGQPAQEIDAQIVADVRNFLFAENAEQGPGMDLAALNIQRGRDHGLPGYNDIRAAFGLSRRTDFAEVSGDPLIEATLRSHYESVDAIDAFVGALAEDHLDDANVGELIATVLAKQFARLRDGDSFFFTNPQQRPFFEQPDIRELVDVYDVTLADIIAMNTSIASPELLHGFFVVPEPRSWLLIFGLGLAVAGRWRRLVR